jgi:hypothetical protein
MRPGFDMRPGTRLFALLLTPFLAISAHAAVVEGVVLDEESGNPLARTVVTLIPLPGTPAGIVSIRAGDRGTFTILSVRPGWYVLRTARKGFATAEAGQLRPGRPGMPFEVTADTQSNFLQIRMRRLGAVTGSVLDENSVGIPEWPVNVYTSHKPIQRLAQVKTDDRGLYRIGELEAGSYIVRSSEGILEDGTSLLPTYYKYGIAVENSEPSRVRLGEMVPDIVIRPVKGKLLELGGILNGPGDRPVQLTMITDTGRKMVASLGTGSTSTTFRVSAVAPGPVEFLAEGSECGGYIRVLAERDTSGLRIGCGPVRAPFVTFSVDKSRSRLRFPILVRRVDLDGTGPERTFKDRDTLVPGHWEVMAQPTADYYVTSIRSSFGQEPVSRDDGWFGLDFGTYSDINVQLSSHPASISGAISTGGKPVSGAMVYLELYNPDLIEPRVQLLNARADDQGSYKFAGLAPGRYRILSSFDFDTEDRFAMERAAILTLREGDLASQALEIILP